MTLPDSARARFGLLFVGVARRWRAGIDAGLADAGLSDATWSALVHIGRAGGGLSQTELADRVGIRGSTLVRLLDILVKKGFVERRQGETDRRENLVFLKPEGEAMLQHIQGILDTLEGQMLAGLGDAELEALTAALERIDEGVRTTVRGGKARS